MRIKFHKKNLSDMDKILLNQIGKLKGNQWTGYYLDIPSSEEWRFRVIEDKIYYNGCRIIRLAAEDNTTLYPQQICQAVTNKDTFTAKHAKLANPVIIQQIVSASKNYLAADLAADVSYQREILNNLVNNNPNIVQKYFDLADRDSYRLKDNPRMDSRDVHIFQQIENANKDYLVARRSDASYQKKTLNGLVKKNREIVEKYFDLADRGSYRLKQGVNLEGGIQDPNDPPVPDSIKTAILKLIEDRITKIDSTRGVFKDLDKSTKKVAVLKGLYKDISETNPPMPASAMKTFVETWRKQNTDIIEKARYTMAIFKRPTKTQKMIEDIENTLSPNKTLK
jgi:hypothetical protein